MSKARLAIAILGAALAACTVTTVDLPVAHTATPEPTPTTAAVPEPSPSAPSRRPPAVETHLAAIRGGTALVSISVAGGDAAVLLVVTGGRRALHSAWSPDGSRLAFDAQLPRCCSDIWTVKADGHDVVPLTSESPADIADAHPDWSPDGARVIFAATLTATPSRIWTLEVAAKTRLRLSAGPGEDVDPSWLPEGRGFAFSRAGAPGEAFHVMTSTLEGAVVKVTDGAASDRSPRVDAAGTRVAFSRQAPGQPPHIFTCALDGSDLRQLTAEDGETDPAWSADGERIAYVRGGAVWVMNADGSARRQLTPAAGYTSPAWRPAG